MKVSQDVSEGEQTTPIGRARKPGPPPVPAKVPRNADATSPGVRGARQPSPDDLLDNLPTQAVLRPAPEVANDAGPLPPGTKMGRYFLVEHVGSGGLGDVYKAYDPELDRRIAIKLLRAEVVDANRRLGDPTARLRREAQALAKLRHPNVVVVHDVGVFEHEVFLAMEFAAGKTLMPWARAHGQQWKTVRDVFSRAGEGLAAAHDAGLVHRDFKPANVVVEDTTRVTVLDFGLARAVDSGVVDDPLPQHDETTAVPRESSTGASSLLSREVTGRSLLLGTPPYMAPELYYGSPATQASDQFAFCVSLYRVLFDRLPFVAKTGSEFCAAVRRGELNFSGRSLPGWLTRLITRGLRHEPEDRFVDMRTLLSALHTDRTRRRRGLLAAAFLIPLAGVATGVAAWAFRPDATPEQRAITEQLATQARAAAARGYYVHPPPEQPQTPTALSQVLELEALDGPVASEADDTASGLRGEFSEALIRLGDRYYEREGGAPFAADFYATALVFDPDNAHARERVALSPAQLAALVDRAEQRNFTETELQAAQPLAILADEEAERRAAKLATFLARNATTPNRTKTMLAGLVDQTPRQPAPEPKVAAPGQRPPPIPAELLEPTAPTVPVADILIEPDALQPAKVDSDAGSGGKQPVDNKAAAKETKAGEAALRQGDLNTAAAAFHRALEHNRRSAAAIAGLADVAYERGKYGESLRYAERARSLAPRSKRVLLLLGDAYLRVFRYADARKAYEAAQKRGSSQAATRLARLAAKQGRDQSP